MKLCKLKALKLYSKNPDSQHIGYMTPSFYILEELEYEYIIDQRYVGGDEYIIKKDDVILI